MRVNAYATLKTPIDPLFAEPGAIKRGFPDIVERAGAEAAHDPQFTGFEEHLEGFSNYIATRHEDSQLSDSGSTLAQLLDHVHSVNWQYTFECDVEDPAVYRQLLLWAREVNAVLFMADGMVIDVYGRPLLPTPSYAGLGEVPAFESSARRSQRVRGAIQAQAGIQIPPHVPNVRTDEETTTKTVEDIRLRAIALCMVSDYGFSVRENDPIDPNLMKETSPQGFAALTPTEQELFRTQDPELANSLSWRCEAVGALMWAVGLYDLPSPYGGEQVSCPEAFPAALGDISTYKLRPISDLLDAQQTYRDLIWAATANLLPVADDSTPGDGFSLNIAVERLWALNWLLDIHAVDWDTVAVTIPDIQ